MNFRILWISWQQSRRIIAAHKAHMKPRFRIHFYIYFFLRIKHIFWYQHNTDNCYMHLKPLYLLNRSQKRTEKNGDCHAICFGVNCTANWFELQWLKTWLKTRLPMRDVYFQFESNHFVWSFHRMEKLFFFCFEADFASMLSSWHDVRVSK